MKAITCPGSHLLPAVRYQVHQGDYLSVQGECQGCGHLYSVNQDGGVIKHSGHGCTPSLRLATCTRAGKNEQPGHIVGISLNSRELLP